jgi:hypothetical protein
LNESSEEESHATEEPPRENEVIIIKYLKDNKTAGADSIAVELLKSGGPSLVNALSEMI